MVKNGKIFLKKVKLRNFSFKKRYSIPTMYHIYQNKIFKIPLKSSFLAILLSLLSNPSTAWLLLNTIQIIHFLPLSKFDLTTTSVRICKTFGQFNLIPNLPELILNPNCSTMSSELADKIGIQTTNFWINVGSEVTFLLGMIVLLPVLLVIKRYNLGFISKKVNDVVIDYRYSVFIRFWLQSHLAVGVYSLINFESVNFK